MNSKLEMAYQIVFTEFNRILHESIGGNFNLQSITVDFEIGLQNALRKTFPEQYLIGCLFHFKHAMIEYASKNSLKQANVLDSSTKLIGLMGKLCETVTWREQFEDVERETNKEYGDTYLWFLCLFPKNIGFPFRKWEFVSLPIGE